MLLIPGMTLVSEVPSEPLELEWPHALVCQDNLVYSSSPCILFFTLNSLPIHTINDMTALHLTHFSQFHLRKNG